MSDPFLPAPYDQLGHRPFSFYPAVVNIDHNEWRLRRVTWSEILVGNTKTDQEIWMPRRFLGEISRTDHPVMIVGLTKEVEYRAGQVVPHIRRVIEMPRAVNEGPRPPVQEPEPKVPGVVGIRYESGAEKRIGRFILYAMAAGILACVVLIAMFRADRNPRVSFRPVLQSDLGLTSNDDYFAVVRKLGTPAEDRWLSDVGERQYRLLKYPDRQLAVILMGQDRDKALYIGAVDDEWRPVDAVSLPGGKDTYPLLRALRRF
jgi:hypothetical protein